MPRGRTAVAVLVVLALAEIALGVVLGLGDGPRGGATASPPHASRVAPYAGPAAGGGATAGGPGHSGLSTGARRSGRHQARTRQAPTRHARTRPGEPAVPATTLLAAPHGTIPKFAFPGGPESGQVPGTWHYAPSVLPVIARRPGWLKVRLAQRPNESTAWVHAHDVTLSSTPYAITLDLAATHLSLYRHAHKLFSAPVGVGLPQYPTPTGSFFVAFFAPPATPAYGAFVVVTSAHSNTISDWDLSGDAMTAIHGPLGSDAQIGTTGARVSHGCIRMHDNDLLGLRHVPPGSPVIIQPS